MSEEEDHEKGPDKSSNQNRNYGCPCGKTYLSYPALFTHVRQKHGGNEPPGELIKPKTQKTRGRPKIRIEIPDKQLKDDNDSVIDFKQQIIKAIPSKEIKYEEEFESGEGRTCKGMATSFLNTFADTTKQDDQELLLKIRRKTLICFLNYVKFQVDQHWGEGYWENKDPAELIDIVNNICLNAGQYTKNFPLEVPVVASLSYILFKWMYAEQWTKHKLFWRTRNQEEKQNENEALDQNPSNSVS